MVATAGDGEKRWPHKCVYKPTRSALTSLSFGLGLGRLPLLHLGLYPAGRRSPLSSFALPFDRIIEGTAGVPRPGDERALKPPCLHYLPGLQQEGERSPDRLGLIGA
jgi:hypothetical protein